MNDTTYQHAFSYGIALPGNELRNYISHFWFSRFHKGVHENFTYHSTANTSTELVFAFAGNTPVFSSAQGHSETYNCIKTGGFAEMFGVAIYSHALPFFFNASALDLANQLIKLDELTNMDVITDQLVAAGNFNKRVELFTSYLKQCLNNTRKTDHAMLQAIQAIRQKRGDVNIHELAADLSLSQKQFERRFKVFSGFNPKLYARILRFESAISCYETISRFTDLALDLGYYDQAHFINDFKKFAGASPGKFAPITL